ncbi:unnamed protein product [Rhizopus stolonifer]
MKFSKHLESQSVPEWRKAYIDYKELKKELKQVEKFRKSKEKKAAGYLDLYFQELESNPWKAEDCKNSFAHHFDRSTSRSASNQTDKTSLSVLDEVLFHASSSERQFFESLDFELDKISKFYEEKERDAKLKLEALKIQMHYIAELGRQLLDLEPAFDIGNNSWFKYQDQSYSLSPNHEGQQRISYNVARSRLKKAITEYYKSLEFLKSYKELNETGFQKILKKFDKVAGWKAGPLYMKVVKMQYWVNSSDLDHILQETEVLYINEFADGHRSRGMNKLRAPKQKKDFNSTTLRVGIYLGLSISFFIQALSLVVDPNTANRLPNLYTNTQIYACFLLPILFCLGFSINLIVWHRSRINYKFIFELNPRDNLDYHQFAELPSILLLISSFVMYLDFSQLAAPHIPSELCPLILFVIYVSILFCPFDLFYLSARRWLGATLARIVLSYCFPVEFRDFFIADELNSLSYSIWTLSYFFCAYSIHWTNLEMSCTMTQNWASPILSSLPPWWRLLQCLKRYKDSNEKVHLLNAAKYTAGIMVALVTGIRRMYPSSCMHSIWVIVCFINSCYTCTWDLKMDWGLFITGSRHKLLRDELVFYQWTYYVAISINIILRFSWTLGLIKTSMNAQLFSILIALLEAYRRIQWNFFRLENEHLNNCGQYRAIKEIPLPFTLLENMDALERASIQSVDNSRRPSYYTIRRSYDAGSFYGRRDFENKQDEDISAVDNVCKSPSTLENVLTRIRSIRGSESEDEDDD